MGGPPSDGPTRPMASYVRQDIVARLGSASTRHNINPDNQPRVTPSIGRQSNNTKTGRRRVVDSRSVPDQLSLVLEVRGQEAEDRQYPYEDEAGRPRTSTGTALASACWPRLGQYPGYDLASSLTRLGHNQY